MTAIAPGIENLSLSITEETHVRAPLAATFAALLEEMGPSNEGHNGTPMPMTLEPWPGGRWFRDLGDKNYLMLRNHGLLTAAASIADAFAFMYFFEASCMIQVRAQSGGSELIPIPQRVLDGFPMAANKVRLGAAGPGTLARSVFAAV